MNKCIFTGRVARDIDVKYTPSGMAVAEFTLAVDDGYGEKKKTYWPRFTAFGKLAEVIGNNLGKGRKVLVECRYTQKNYDGKDGQKKTSSRFIVESLEFLDSTKQKDDFSSIGEELPGEEIPF